jgi:hypothetical protein
MDKAGPPVGRRRYTSIGVPILLNFSRRPAASTISRNLAVRSFAHANRPRRRCGRGQPCSPGQRSIAAKMRRSAARPARYLVANSQLRKLCTFLRSPGNNHACGFLCDTACQSARMRQGASSPVDGGLHRDKALAGTIRNETNARCLESQMRARTACDGRRITRLSVVVQGDVTPSTGRRRSTRS